MAESMTDRYLQIAISRDGAQTFGDWTTHPLQRDGKYSDPQPTRRRCGTDRQFVAKVRCTSPVDVTFIGIETEASREG